MKKIIFSVLVLFVAAPTLVSGQIIYSGSYEICFLYVTQDSATPTGIRTDLMKNTKEMIHVSTRGGVEAERMFQAAGSPIEVLVFWEERFLLIWGERLQKFEKIFFEKTQTPRQPAEISSHKK